MWLPSLLLKEKGGGQKGNGKCLPVRVPQVGAQKGVIYLWPRCTLVAMLKFVGKECTVSFGARGFLWAML